MKCKYCGGEISNGDKCEFCDSRISYEMKRELEQLNKKGCPACGSSNVSFTREQEGVIWDARSKKYIRRTVGICHDCGHTWYTDFSDKTIGSSTKPTGNTGGDAPPKKPVPKEYLWIPAILLIMMILLGQCHDENREDPGPGWSPEEETAAEEETTEYERELNILTINPVDNRELEVGQAEIITHTGRIEKEDQDDIYSFSPSRDGTYRIELSGIHDNGAVWLSIDDELGERLDFAFPGNGGGITLPDLKKGKKYKIHVSYDNVLSPYTLSIASQKKRESISSYSLIKDSIEFTDQDNVYSFEAPLSGVYRFEFSEIHDNKWFMLSIDNDLGERLDHSFAGNNEGITINLEEGEKYTIHVKEGNGFSPYHLKIGKQKEYKDISQFDGVQDSVEFTDQDNVYLYTASSDGEYEFVFSEMKNKIYVYISIFNRLGERLTYNFCDNDDAFTIDNLEAGETYEIHVKYENGTSPYVMTIQQGFYE